MYGERKYLCVMRITVTADHVNGFAFALTTSKRIMPVVSYFSITNLDRNDAMTMLRMSVEDDIHTRRSRPPTAIKFHRRFGVDHLELVFPIVS